jgi:hypothetical protein
MAGPAAAPSEAPAQDAVSIELGPDTTLYPERFRPAPESPPSQPAQESDEAGATPQPTEHAGPSEEPPKEGEPKGSRRQRGEDAYQRGLREGREAADRERTERQTAEDQQKAAENERARIRQLFVDLKSPDYDTRTNASNQLADVYSANEQNQALEVQVRTKVLEEIGSQFKNLAQVEGIGEDGHKQLLGATSPAEFAKTAFELGTKHAKAQADERIAELEAQLEAERGRRAGASLSPERSNGSNGAGARLTLEQYQRMSARELKQAGITSADIDALTAELMAEAARTR